MPNQQQRPSYPPQPQNPLPPFEQDALDILQLMHAEFKTNTFIHNATLYATIKTPSYAFNLIEWLLATNKIKKMHNPHFYIKT